jgi:hypothetical protein
MSTMNNDSSQYYRSRAVVHTKMSLQQPTKNDDPIVNLRIKRSTMQRFRLQGYFRQSADEVLRGVLDKVETCRCRGGPRRLTI